MKIVTHERELELNSLEESDDITDPTMTTPKLTSRPKKGLFFSGINPGTI